MSEDVLQLLEGADGRLDEEELLEMVREARGEEFVEEHRGAILADAKRMGMI